MPTLKLTKRIVEGQAPGARDIVLWDTEVIGFGCKVTPAGRRSYFCYYRTQDGIQRRPAIGKHGTLTVQEARDIARRWLVDAAGGGDPSHRRHKLRRAPTMADLCRRFLTEHAAHRNKAGTAYNYERMTARFILPELGTRKVADISIVDVEKLHQRLRSTPYQANRVLELLSKMMRLAERWGYRPSQTPFRNGVVWLRVG